MTVTTAKLAEVSIQNPHGFSRLPDSDQPKISCQLASGIPSTNSCDCKKKIEGANFGDFSHGFESQRIMSDSTLCIFLTSWCLKRPFEKILVKLDHLNLLPGADQQKKIFAVFTTLQRPPGRMLSPINPKQQGVENQNTVELRAKTSHEHQWVNGLIRVVAPDPDDFLLLWCFPLDT